MACNNSEISIGDNVTVNISNTGTDTSTGGGNYVGYVESQQVYWETFPTSLITAGDNFNVTISNSGSFTPNPSVSIPTYESVGYISEELIEIFLHFKQEITSVL